MAQRGANVRSVSAFAASVRLNSILFPRGVLGGNLAFIYSFYCQNFAEANLPLNISVLFVFVHTISVTATCDQEMANNITYFVSPSFPALVPRDMSLCKLKIKLMSEEITQLKFDFIHFALVIERN